MTSNTDETTVTKPFPEWIPNPGEAIPQESKDWIAEVVQKSGPDCACKIYSGTCAVDQYGREIIKAMYGIDAKVVVPGKKERKLRTAA
jgi:hypothetical protein